MTMRAIIRTLQGLEPVLSKELNAMGCTEVKELKRAVACEMTKEQLYKSNLMLRSAIKVMIPILETKIGNDMDLYDAVKQIAWEDYISLKQTFAIEGVTHSEHFRNSQYVALKAKDAIADKIRDKFGKRPFVNPVNPDINIIIHVRANILTVLLDSTGSSLHMRGYRVYPTEAPLNEVLAAGMVMLSEWDQKIPFLDPMCGSGTLAIEAAMIACKMPPQKLDRKYCFQQWHDYDKNLWRQVSEEASNNINLKDCPLIYAMDRQLSAVTATNANAQEKGLDGVIKTKRQDFFSSICTENSHLILNPPYDMRIKEDDIVGFYKKIGDTFKKEYKGCTSWVLGGNIDALKHLGLKPSKKISLLNGDIESGFYKFEMYEGSKKNMDHE